jgi:uncharacterized membrane protein YebE (DUF533 family)
MKRLTLSGDACTETLALLIIVAWADGKVEDNEKEGIRAASQVFNLTKELRERLAQLLDKPMKVEELLFDGLSARDKAFAYVAAAWLTNVDEDVDEKEKQVLDQVATLFKYSNERRKELEQIARDLESLRKEGTNWTSELVSLFKAIPQRLEGDGSETFEVAFE